MTSNSVGARASGPGISADPALTPQTKLYRYVDLASFMSLVETKILTLTNVNAWDNPWEAFLGKIPLVDEDGNDLHPTYSFYELVFAQCWSLISESDAMWRIYSPHKLGIRIESSVDRLQQVGSCGMGYIGKVIYFDSVADLLEKEKPRRSRFDIAMFKRSAFEHEQEVRLLTHADCLENCDLESSRVGLPVDPSALIEGLMVDPRAEDWYVDTLGKYCARLSLPVRPEKSKLYDPDPHLTIGLARQYVRVHP